MEMILEKTDLDMQLNDENLVVAVYMITYNHEKFIEQAIRSVVDQKAYFKYKLFLGDDFSTDKTREICLKLKEKYPEKIHLVLNEKNIGATMNAQNIYKLCFNSGARYIAMLEGDDYWTDKRKLQKQVDFMDKNPNYSICFNNSQQVDKENKIIDKCIITENKEKTFSIEDLALQNFMHTASVLFRKNFTKLPDWIVHSPAGDYPLHMLNARFGLIKYLPETMSVYRLGDGIWSSLSRVNQLISTLMTVQLIINEFKDDAKVKSLLAVHYNSLLVALENFITEKNRVEINKEKIASTLRIRDLLKIIWRKMM